MKQTAIMLSKQASKQASKITLSGEDNKDASTSGHFVSKKQNEL